jgi:hypothetical protein
MAVASDYLRVTTSSSGGENTRPVTKEVLEGEGTVRMKRRRVDKVIVLS